MDLELWYKGSVHRFNGYGMDSVNIENRVESSMIQKMVSTGISDLKVRLNEIKEDGVSFSVFYFEKETNYFIKKGEEITHKYEGNAFGFEIVFSLRG